MKYPKIPLAQTVISLCKAKEIEQVVISPGSRSAPLTIGFTNDPFFKCYSVVDERCAAFFALGIAQKMRKPVALVCTSGSALLNYFPAVAEAYYSKIPLVVLSADRPKHLIEIGDGQTIKQPNVFGEHVHYSANLKLDLKDDLSVSNDEEIPIIKNLEHKLERFLGLQKGIQDYNEEEIYIALAKSILNSGPVHINVPFDEPLYETVNELSVSVDIKKIPEVKYDIDSYLIKEFVSLWESSKRKMILIGSQQPNLIDKEWIGELAMDPSVIVFTETTSNVHHKNFFPKIDQIIAPLDDVGFETLKPDILLTFGGMVVSKKIKSFLRKYKPKEHWHVDPYRAYDTFFCLDNHVKVPVNTFLSELFQSTTHHIRSNYFELWNEVRVKRNKLQKRYLENLPFTDLLVFSSILRTLPKNCVLQVGNSSAIRYTQLFNISESVEIYCNRGTSGIDGSTSTAIGHATVSKKPVVFVTGDLSFFYDSNALWNDHISSSFRIILINNLGGGIFRILPGHKNTENFDTYFETKHNLNAEHLCKMYNFEYTSANSVDSLENGLHEFYKKSKTPKLLEIFTQSELNDEVLLNLFEVIA